MLKLYNFFVIQSDSLIHSSCVMPLLSRIDVLRLLAKRTFFLLIMSVLGINCAFAVSSSEVSQNLNGLINQINKVNDDLNNNQKQQQHLSKAISDSNDAIDQSQELLDHLKSQRNLDMKQLDEIETVLPQLTSATQMAESNVKTAINKTYKQLRILQNNDSVISGNDNLLNERKKKYLIKLLVLEQQKYAELQAKLDKLNQVNDNISAELDKIDKQLGTTSRRKSQLQQEKDAKLQQAALLQQKISKEKALLANLKQQQQQLNNLLQNLQAAEAAEKAKQVPPKQIVQGKPDYRYEDNSPFLSRKLSRPVENGTVIVKFGDVRDSVPNNGILFKASNSPIHAISSGRILFSGVLPGFGQMVVVDNGDNYTSIYGGILPSVTKNQQVSASQVIGSSGTVANQPMGGVYFELRHLGKPVNPSKLQ